MGRFLLGALGLVVLMVLGWSAWWWLGAEAQRAGLEAWMAKQRERGWLAEAGAVRSEEHTSEL